MSKMYGSIYENYIDSCYYYDIVDLLRGLLLTGGLRRAKYLTLHVAYFDFIYFKLILVLLRIPVSTLIDKQPLHSFAVGR